MKPLVLLTVFGAAVFQAEVASGASPETQITLTLNAPNPLTNECHLTFSDPGATAVGWPVAISAGAEHSLALWGDGSVIVWGGNRYQQQNMPAGLSNAVAIAAGGFHSLALRANGTIVGWGDNSRGQAVAPEGLSNVVAVSGGGEHSLGLRSDGSVVGWGWNMYGQAQPPAGLSDVVAISAGSVHSLALRSDGTVVAWGTGISHGSFPNSGQCLVPAGLTNVIAIAGGGVHSLALRADGTVVAWGAGETNQNAWPDFGQSVVPDGLSNVVAIAAGHYHSLALCADGTVVAWGAGATDLGGSHQFGQTIIPAGLSNVVAIAAGDYHNLALPAGGPVEAWGWNEFHQTSNRPGSIDLTDRIVTASDVVTNVPGTYTIIYTVTDYFGHTVTATRTVILPGPCFGSRDSTFDPASGGALPGFEGASPTPYLRALALEPDGRIYVGGDFSAINGVPRPGVARLLADGTLDPSFQPAWTNALAVVALARQTDGKLLVLWRSSIHNFPPQPGGGVTRLNADGSLDATFTNYWSGDWVPYVQCLALQADGKFLVGGEFMEPRTGVARFHADGTLDGTFTPPLLPAYDGATVKAIVVQPDGNILVGGSYGIDLLRLNSDGSEDDNFHSGVEIGGSVNAIQLQPDGHILVGGFIGCACGGQTQMHNVVRLRTDGSLDDSFSAVLDIVPLTLARQANGRILAAGECYGQEHDAGIFRFNPDGSRDTTFQAWVDIWYGWPNVNAMLVQPDGKLLIGGGFTSVNGRSVVAIARLDGGPVASPVIAWGSNYAGQGEVPGDLGDAQSVVAVAGGLHHSVALRMDGTLVTWGGNEFDQRNVPPGLANVAAIAVGPYHTLALTREGRVVAWGDGSAGRTDVPAGLNNAVAVAAGTLHSLALLDNGTVVAWGSNLDQDDEYVGQATIPAGLTNVLAIAAGDYHSLALLSDGCVVAWGANSAGQTDVPTTLTNAVAIAAAGARCLAVRANHTLVGWGDDPYVPIDLTNVVAVAMGATHSLALTRAGAAIAWGDSEMGQLNVPEGLTNVVAIAAGGCHSLALCCPLPAVPLRLCTPTFVGNRFGLRVPTMEGRQYILEFKDGLSSPAWNSMPGVKGYGYGVTRTLADPTADRPQRFYRVRSSGN